MTITLPIEINHDKDCRDKNSKERCPICSAFDVNCVCMIHLCNTKNSKEPMTTTSNEDIWPPAFRRLYMNCINKKHYPIDIVAHNVDNVTPCLPNDQSLPLLTETLGSEGNKSYRVPINTRFDLIPPIALRQLAEVFEEGAKKYGEQKYTEKPLLFSVILNHVYNHLNLLQSGDHSELHAAKVMWGMCAIIVLESLANEGVLPDQDDVSKWGLMVIPSSLGEDNGPTS